jgi:fructose/tagatose bisphosphate aldolase
LAESPAEFDPRKYLGPARDELINLVIQKAQVNFLEKYSVSYFL